jgi:hypothetical protein
MTAQALRTLALGGFILGCSGASWRSVEIDAPYERPKAVTVSIIAPPKAREAADALAAAVVEGLASEGIQARAVPATSGSADATLTIVKWDAGTRSLRWFLYGVGRGTIVVEFDGIVGVEGTVDGWVNGGILGGASENSATAVGHLIAKTIATGESMPTVEPTRAR